MIHQDSGRLHTGIMSIDSWQHKASICVNDIKLSASQILLAPSVAFSFHKELLGKISCCHHHAVKLLVHRMQNFLLLMQTFERLRNRSYPYLDFVKMQKGRENNGI